MITRERLEEWIGESGGDPWGYDEPFVQDRLDASLAFIQRYVPADFGGTFVEIGAFNGAFTARLATAFASCSIIANDIAQAAIDQARKKVSGFANITFDRSDLAEFRLPEDFAGKPTILVLMEALYYIPKDTQAAALKNLLGELPSAQFAFISGPIRGDDYLDEDVLVKLFAKSGFGFVAAHALNTTDAFIERHTYDRGLGWKMAAKLDPIAPRYARMLRNAWFEYKKNREAKAVARLSYDPRYRMKYGRQVIYCFRRDTA